MISVVIPARDAATCLTAQLDALAGQADPGVPWEVIVADNGSIDATGGIVRERSAIDPRVRLVDASRAPGPNVARNVGVEAARGDLIALCDADDVVSDGWVRAFVQAHQASSSGLMSGRVEAVMGPEGRTFGRSVSAYRDAPPRPMGFLPAALGANMCFEKQAWAAVSGFDEDWGVDGGDDTDFCWRVQLAGFHLEFVPDAIVSYQFRTDRRGSLSQIHRYSVGTPKMYRRFREHGAQRRSILGATRSWLTLILTIWKLLGPVEMRDRWLHLFAKNVGYLVGSWRFRVFYP